MIRFDRIIICLFAVSILSGCRKELCYNHYEHSYSIKVAAIAEWECEWERFYIHNWREEWKPSFGYSYEELCPHPAEGIRAIVYGENNHKDETNLPTEGGRLPMREGKQSVLLYNNDTEYIVFDGLSVSSSANATTRSLSRATLGELHKGERHINQPDQLYGCFVKDYVCEKTLDLVEIPVTMHPLTYTYLIRYEFSHGLQYVALARGALAGMAEKVYLNDGHTGDDAATILFDCEIKNYGTEARMKCFGVPNFPGDHYTRGDGSASRYTLNLEVMLKNGKLKNDFPLFDVTDQVNAQPRGGVIIVSGIEISDEEGGGGGFDVKVDGWGDYIDIPLELN